MQKKDRKTTQYNLLALKRLVSKTSEKIVVEAFLGRQKMCLRIKMNSKAINKRDCVINLSHKVSKTLPNKK